MTFKIHPDALARFGMLEALWRSNPQQDLSESDSGNAMADGRAVRVESRRGFPAKAREAPVVHQERDVSEPPNPHLIVNNQ